MSSILLVEDDRMLRRAVAGELPQLGLRRAEAGSGEEALSMVSNEPARPRGARSQPCRASTGSRPYGTSASFTDVPVVVLTVRDSLRDKITALESGADDYVLKPFEPEELLARSRAHLRRSAGEHAARRRCGRRPRDRPGRELRDLAGRASCSSRPPSSACSRCCSRTAASSSPASSCSRRSGARAGRSDRGRVRVFMVHLRRKLHDDAARPRLILTEPGLGYRWIERRRGARQLTGCRRQRADSSVGLLRFTKANRRTSVIVA